MSGHSKWSTIKHKKEATDAARGKLFSKLSKQISIAVKDGGGTNPETNIKLKYAIEQAKASNMPKANIDRALKRGSDSSEGLVEVTYEGFGPEGIQVIVEVTTNNRNRSGQEIKGIFERGGGSLAGPGAVSFNFEKKGMILVKKEKNPQDQILNLIDLGVDDVEEVTDGIEVYVNINKLSTIKESLEKRGIKILSHQIIRKPINLQKIENKESAKKILTFLNDLEEHDDVQVAFANIDIPEKILESIKE